jgi:hypothetical protein
VHSMAVVPATHCYGTLLTNADVAFVTVVHDCSTG